MMKRIATALSSACAAVADALLGLSLRLAPPERKAPVKERPALAELLERAGYREIPLEQVPPPRPKPEMPLPPPGLLDHARALNAEVKVCRGSKKGCDGRDDQDACRDCYFVHWYDRRSSAEILQAIERGDA